MLMRVCAGFVAVLALFIAPAVHAQSAAPAVGLVIDENCTETPSSQAEDEEIAERALTAINQGGYRGLSSHLSALRRVTERAPGCFPQIVRQGGSILVRSNDPQEGLTLSLVLSSLSVQERGSGEIRVAPNPYPLVLLLLASNEVEARRFDRALTYIDQGLALQPNHQFLLFEKVAALMGLRRHQESADLVQGMIDNPALQLTLDQSRAYRMLGVILIDLNRLDDAERALNESIRIEPNNPGARSELQYIVDLRRGAEQRELELTSPAGRSQ